jgi:hypothetical protein
MVDSKNSEKNIRPWRWESTFNSLKVINGFPNLCQGQSLKRWMEKPQRPLSLDVQRPQASATGVFSTFLASNNNRGQKQEPNKSGGMRRAEVVHYHGRAVKRTDILSTRENIPTFGTTDAQKLLLPVSGPMQLSSHVIRAQRKREVTAHARHRA